jgi:hypothetical protein
MKKRHKSHRSPERAVKLPGDVIRQARRHRLYVLAESGAHRGSQRWAIFDRGTGLQAATYWPRARLLVTGDSHHGGLEPARALEAVRELLDVKAARAAG